MHLISCECAYVYPWYGRVSMVSEMPRKKIRGIKEVYPVYHCFMRPSENSDSLHLAYHV